GGVDVVGEPGGVGLHRDRVREGIRSALGHGVVVGDGAAGPGGQGRAAVRGVDVGGVGQVALDRVRDGLDHQGRGVARAGVGDHHGAVHPVTDLGQVGALLGDVDVRLEQVHRVGVGGVDVVGEPGGVGLHRDRVREGIRSVFGHGVAVVYGGAR